MKTPQKSLVSSLLALLGLLSLSSQAFAATVYWDANGAGGVGGTGEWAQPGSAFWNPNADGSGVLATWTGGDLADFRGTAGTVTVNGTVNVGGGALTPLVFNVGGYTLTGGTIAYTPIGDFSSWNLINFAAGSSNMTISSDININATARTGGTASFKINNATANNLQLDGNYVLTNAIASSHFFDLVQTNAAGSITLNGSISTSAAGGPALRIGNGGLSSASYYINGNNSGLTNGNSADLVKGIVYVGHASALGNNTVRFGNGNASGDTIQLLTNDALTIANAISLTSDVGATRVLGGATSQNSTYTGGINFNNTNYALRLTAAAGGRVDFSNVINDGSATGGSIEKIGAGTVRLTPATGNTYDGGTTVTEGVLLANSTSNSSTGTGNVTVVSGATLGGTGRIVPTTGKSLTVQGNGILLGGEGAAATGTLTVAGDVNLSNDSVIKLVLGSSLTHSTIARASGTWVFDSNQTVSFSVVGATTGTYENILTGLASDPGVASWVIDPASGVSGSFTWDGSNVDLNVSVIPEPATGMLLIVGGLSFLILRRRSR